LKSVLGALNYLDGMYRQDFAETNTEVMPEGSLKEKVVANARAISGGFSGYQYHHMLLSTFSKTKKTTPSIGIQGRFSDTMFQVHQVVKSGSMELELILIIQEKIFMLDDTIMSDQSDQDILTYLLTELSPS
jgi:hypothetical protein